MKVEHLKSRKLLLAIAICFLKAGTTLSGNSFPGTCLFCSPAICCPTLSKIC